MVFGNLDCEVVEILAGGRMIGDVKTTKFIIQDCGIFNGACQYKGKDIDIELEEAQKLEFKKSKLEFKIEPKEPTPSAVEPKEP